MLTYKMSSDNWVTVKNLLSRVHHFFCFLAKDYYICRKSQVEESHTWCRFTRFSKSVYQNPPSRRVTEDKMLTYKMSSDDWLTVKNLTRIQFVSNEGLLMAAKCLPEVTLQFFCLILNFYFIFYFLLLIKKISIFCKHQKQSDCLFL